MRVTLWMIVSGVVLSALLMLTLPSDGNLIGVIACTMAIVAATTFYVNGVIGALIGRLEHTVSELQISEYHRDRLEQELREASQIDEVSGCFNEKYLVEQCQQMLAMNRRGGMPFVLLVVRVDQYLNVLSEDGSVGARELLGVCGGVFKRSIREVDLVARLDEEVFGVLLCDADATAALVVAERMMALLRQVRIRGDEKHYVTISGGIATHDTGEDVPALMANARSAVEVAEEGGKDRVAVYVPARSLEPLRDVS